MPGPKTHDIFYKELKEHLNEKTLQTLPNYDKFNLFAQGHDFLIYHNFYKIWNKKALDKNVSNSVLLQEYSFPEFVYNYLKEASDSGAIEDEQTRLFIGPGYIMHHILDAYTHPMIIYYAGDHTRNPKNDTWRHGIVENLIDIYLLKTKEKVEPKTYLVYNDFKVSEQISTDLVSTITKSIDITYGMENAGEIFKQAFYQTELFMKTLKYDSKGIKRKVLDFLDPILKGTSSFSYHRDVSEDSDFLNFQHETWLHPMDCNIVSNKSFLDLYNQALKDGSYIVDEIEKICQKGIINKDDIYSLIPNISSTHGLECGQELKINNIKNR
ncbi:MAG: hypothetical protein U0L20_02765 [Ruminococcus sp.]|nr:hypothetical protein [Ruminococcus sp.]